MKYSISVVHLIWLPFGIDFFERFIQSYTLNKTSVQHQLVLLFNGVNNKKDIEPYLQLTKCYHLKFTYFILEKGQDLDAYKWLAKQLNAEYILFLNSYSQIMSPNWLNIYVDNFTKDIGLLSATGSYQSYYSSVFQTNKWKYEFDKSFKFNFKKYKLIIKAFCYWRFCFDKFPAMHIRTNAFMINRQLFVEKINFNQPIKNKFAAYKIESGKNSIANQIVKLKLGVAIVGLDGKKYYPNDWKESNIFWKGNQENLLISDNQTRFYDAATFTEKKQLTFLAWGK